MGFIDNVLGISGNASEMSLEEAREKLNGVLYDGENIELAYKLYRDMIVFADKRLIIVNIQGTGKKIEYKTIPYKSIQRFSVETTGNFDLDAEVKLFLSGGGYENLAFRKDKNIQEIQQILAQRTL